MCCMTNPGGSQMLPMRKVGVIIPEMEVNRATYPNLPLISSALGTNEEIGLEGL